MVYTVKTYELIGKTIKVFTERPDIKVIKGEHGEKQRFVDSDGSEPITGPLTTLTVHESEAGLMSKHFHTHLPYRADVTEYLPGGCKFEPKTYKNCQLLAETHGGYLQFFDWETKKTLRIAINSNTYSPLKQ